MPCDWDKRLTYSNKMVKHSIKTVSSLILPTQLIQPGYATATKYNKLIAWSVLRNHVPYLLALITHVVFFKTVLIFMMLLLACMEISSYIYQFTKFPLIKTIVLLKIYGHYSVYFET